MIDYSRQNVNIYMSSAVLLLFGLNLINKMVLGKDGEVIVNSFGLNSRCEKNRSTAVTDVQLHKHGLCVTCIYNFCISQGENLIK